MAASRNSRSSAQLVGSERPRLWTRPLRRLTKATSRGYEVAEFADRVLGEPLLPWQRWLAIHALELLPDSTYRFRTVVVPVARQNGKTSFVRTLSLWRMYLDGARLVLGAAQDVSFAREVWTSAVDAIRSSPDLAAELGTVRRTNGDEWFRLANGARWKITATNDKAGRGLSVDQLNLDEVRTQRKWDAWSSLSKTTQARANGQIWCTSNAGDDESVVLNGLRDAGLSGRDESIGLFEWSAPDNCDLEDPTAWQAANPGLGHTVSVAAIRSSLATDPPEVFRSEVLCQRVTSLDGAVDLTAWKDCKDPAQTLDSLRDRVVVVVDVAPDGAHTTLLAAATTDDGRVKVEPVAAWPSTDTARTELPEILGRVGPLATGWFPSGPGAALGPVLRELGAHEIKGAQVAEACMSFADLVAARKIVHPGDPLLDAHMAGASKLHSGDGWRFTRKGAGHCDAAYAAAGAVHLALTLPEEKPMPKPMVV